MRTNARTYTDEEVAEALAVLKANGGNVLQTAKTTGIPRKTICQWRDGVSRKNIPKPLIEKKKRDLGDTIERLAFRLCDVVSRRIKKGTDDSTKDLVVSIAVAVEKLLLIRGEPTSISRSNTASTTVDLSRLSKEQLVQLHELHTKARGETLEEASSLDEPVIVEVVPVVEEKNTNNASEVNDGKDNDHI